jgi:diguanylate cyclase (GGDEF)-like protein
MHDERRTDDLDDDVVLDISKIEDAGAEEDQDSDRAAQRKAAAQRAKGVRGRGPAHSHRDRRDEATEVQRAIDRNQELIDRDQAGLDRDQVALERGASHRGDARELEREQTVLDRDQAALDRDQARLNRAQAALDRVGVDRQDYLIDELTGTLRRGPGLRELKHEIDRARRQGDSLVVAFIDVDGLKAVNDKRGHAAGDQLLRGVAEALKQGLRSYDLVLRYGGDEFLCALSNADVDHAERRLREVAEILGRAPARASIAWGLAQLQADDDVDDLVARADSALYSGRRSRRNRAAE